MRSVGGELHLPTGFDAHGWQLDLDQQPGRLDRGPILTSRYLAAPFSTFSDRVQFFGTPENALSITSPIGCQVRPSN